MFFFLDTVYMHISHCKLTEYTPYVFLAVNNVDGDSLLLNEEKKDLDELNQNAPKHILPYSSMFVFGQANPWVWSLNIV